MKDINFFSIYSDKNSAGYKRKQLIKLGILVLAVILVLYAGLTVWLMTMEAKAQEINEYLMSPAVQESIAEYDRERAKLTAIEEYNMAADNLIGSMDKIYNLTTEKLGIITKALPVSGKFESLGYTSGEMAISINVPSLQSASQTLVRLEETGLFQQVSMHSITRDETGIYNCNISAVMKVGEIDEDNL